MEQTISPRQLRRWFGRVALTLLITFVVSQALSYLSVQIWMTFVGWTNYTILMFLNDFCVYVPSILLIPLLLRSLPQQPPAPVNPLSGQEKFLAVVFSLGSGYTQLCFCIRNAFYHFLHYLLQCRNIIREYRRQLFYLSENIS